MGYTHGRPVKETVEEVESLLAIGTDTHDIARALGVSFNTIERALVRGGAKHLAEPFVRQRRHESMVLHPWDGGH